MEGKSERMSKFNQTADRFFILKKKKVRKLNNKFSPIRGVMMEYDMRNSTVIIISIATSNNSILGLESLEF